LSTRMYLIDSNKSINYKSIKFIFMVEDSCNVYDISLSNKIITCSCSSFNEKQIVCKHIKFILKKIGEIGDNRSRSNSSLNNNIHIFSFTLSLEIDIHKFESNKNPKFKEYKFIEDTDITNYEGNCHICLEKLNNKIIKCKSCKNYFHEECIYSWFRLGTNCACPLCRSFWT
jgi:hypothetical protein